MTSWVRTIAFSFLLISTPCAGYAQAPFAEESKAKTDLREAIFRYMFAHYNYGPNVKVFCIHPERPQPESFLARFAGNTPGVVWSSECDITGPMNGILHKKTGERGLRMNVLWIKWISSGEAEARVEAYSDGIAANWNILRLVSKDGHWNVESEKADGMS